MLRRMPRSVYGLCCMWYNIKGVITQVLCIIYTFRFEYNYWHLDMLAYVELSILPLFLIQCVRCGVCMKEWYIRTVLAPPPPPVALYTRCGDGLGVALWILEGYVMLLDATDLHHVKGCTLTPPYFDEYGESDPGLRYIYYTR